MYADIIVDITHESLDRVFQYVIPPEMEECLDVGMEVVIPFGKANREIRGYIVGFSETTEYDPGKMKGILRVAEDRMAIESKLVKLAAWMHEQYGGTMIQALRVVLPIKKKEREQTKRTIRCVLDREEQMEKLAFYRKKNQKARARLLEALMEDPELEYSLVTKKLHITSSVVRTMEEQGVIEVQSERIFRNPKMWNESQKKEIQYNDEQRAAIDRFVGDYDRGVRGTYLVYGVTGSGKTEVYMEMIRHVVAQGKQAIVLIPEIALTYQTVMRFYRIFGDRVSILNSRMSAGERYDQMQRAKSGELDVMIGPRSALFTPFMDVGLIVIDEEHENTYKSEQVPRYHARETAVKRAEIEGASVILGSATPSMESFYRCESGEYTKLTLANRAGERRLPTVHTVDMRVELKEGNRSIFSDLLREKIEDRLKKGQQTMLFLNRRGMAGFISCRSCGHVVKCPHCDVSLSEHRNGKLICHYCGYETAKIHQCPSCGGKHIGAFKAGTQQIEDLVKKEFPNARVLRMDMDTTKNKDGHEKILAAFAHEDADILVGTQMIVKGHDFPGVTLVGILAADMSLFSGGYRSGERTFQLLAQASGRAGRGEERGEVVVQTYHPEHYSIVCAAKQDYEAFYEEEIQFRELMGYPPAEHLLAVLMMGSDEKHLEMAADYLKKYACRMENESLEIIGPATPAISKVNDIYRKIIYLKSPEYDMLVKAKNNMERYIDVNTGYQTIRIQFDFDPMTML